MKKRIFTLLLAGLMSAGMVSCGDTADTGSSQTTGESSTESSTVEEADSGEVVTLDILSMPANKSGLIEGWWADDVREKLGIEFNLLPAGDQGEQKLQALMASGELPDIVIFKDYKQVENAVIGNMLLAYDDYQDLLPNVYTYASESLQYMADNLSNGQNKAFVVSTEIKHYPDAMGNSGLQVRYDLYKEIGSPEVGTLMDLVPVIQQMQALEPENEDGKKVYGLSLFKDWDRSYMTLAMFAAGTMGYDIPGEGSLVQIDYRSDPNGVVDSLLAEDGIYMQFLRFCFEMNKLDLLDPDSMTQRFDDASDKTASGRVLMMYDGWGTGSFSTAERENQNIGFARLPMIGEKAVQDSLQPVGGNWRIAVGKATEYPEKCMDFINYIYSYDGAMTIMNGPQGVIWDFDEENKPYILEEGYTYMQDPEKELPGGLSLSDGLGQLMCSAYTGAEVLPENDTPLGSDYWEEKDYAPADTELVKTWQADYGAKDLLTYLNQIDAVQIAPFAPTPTLTDEMELISARVGDVVKTLSWQMIFAKDEAEFNSLKEEMISKAEGLGLNDFLEWFRAEYESALEFGKQYTE